MKRITSILLVVATAGVFLFGAHNALAATDPGCTTLGGADGTGTCVVGAGTVAVSGSITVGESLHLLSGAILDASASGVSLTVDPGSFEMDAGSSIRADGDNITVTVPHGDMTMHGTPGTDFCGYNPAPLGSGSPPLGLFPPSFATGAVIISREATLATTITIKVGNFPPPGTGIPPVGSFTMERCSLVDVSNVGGSAGTVVIKAGKESDIDGLVLSESTLTGTGANQAPGGGPITVQSGCKLTISTTGAVSSKGRDPGADLVHLEGCDVFIDGLVQSTGPGHGPPNNPPNHCYFDPSKPPTYLPPLRPQHLPSDTGCIEILGQNITISNTGEVNADVNSTGAGGAGGTSWIDLFAYDDITITGRTGATDVFSVHADTASGSDNSPNTVTAKAGQDLAFPGTFSGTGRILSAAIIGAANGSNGGTVVVEAAGAVNLDSSTIKAMGDNVGSTAGACDSGSGTCGSGGTINVRSFQANITWQNGTGNVNPDESSTQAGSVPGTIGLIACTTVNVTGSSFDDAVPTVSAAAYTNTAGVATPPNNPAQCGGLPAIPPYVDAAFEVGEPIWEACVTFVAHKSGKKFNDLDNSKDLSAGDTPIAGWPINLLTTGNVLVSTTNTLADGSYSFDFSAPGTFRVCEGPPPAGFAGFVQTFPHLGTVHAGETVISTCPQPNVWGYEFTVVNGSNFTDDDFGNNKPSVTCPEDPNRAAKLTRTVGQSQFDGGLGVPGNPKNYSTIQLAYDDAKITAQAEVIGLFANTTENLVLDGSKALTITQCTIARVTAADNGLPVWDIKSTGKLTIISPDSVGGTVGWLLETGPHDLKSIRADGASEAGIKVLSNSNSISWNDADGNGIGVEVQGGSNTLKGGSVSSNKTYGVHFFGVNAKTNTLSGATIESNGSHGVFVEGGSGNKITSNTANKNKGDGFNHSSTSLNTFSSNKSNNGSSGGTNENVGAEYRFVTTATNGTGNKADGVSVPAAAKGCTSFNAGQVCE